MSQLGNTLARAEHVIATFPMMSKRVLNADGVVKREEESEEVLKREEESEEVLKREEESEEIL